MTSQQDSYIIEVKNLTKFYKRGDSTVRIISDLNLGIYRGELLSVMGRSGAGKSTLLGLLSGLEFAEEGCVLFNGKPMTREITETERRLIGFVYQMHHLLPEFSAVENVAMPLLILGACQKDALNSAKEWLDSVGMGHRLNHNPAQLSGGECQRVAIARAMVHNPDCVFLDEPTGNLDAETASEIKSLIIDMAHNTKATFIVVTHDAPFAHKADRIIEIKAHDDIHIIE